MNYYTPFDSAQLVFSGRNYFEVLKEMIGSAKEVIHLQTYILDDDETGRDIIAALETAAGKGVQIFLLVDGFGSIGISENLQKRLNQSGMRFRLFSPLFSPESGVFGRRLHHKIVVTDKKSALVGGINIAGKYRGEKEGLPWLDYAVKIEGSCCAYLHHLCEKLYQRKPVFRAKRLPHTTAMNNTLRFRRNDWIFGKNEVQRSYLEGIDRAEKRIVLVASYFIPGFSFIRKMEKAVKRGVKVSVIETSKTDILFVRLVEKYLYPYLIRAGVNIYEWPSSVMHGKAMVIDGQWTTIGSYNINYLSHYRSIELNVDLKSREFATSFEHHLEDIIRNHCHLVTAKAINHQFGPFYKLLTLFVYHFLRLVMNWFMPMKGYHKRPKKEKIKPF